MKKTSRSEPWGGWELGLVALLMLFLFNMTATFLAGVALTASWVVSSWQ